MKKPPQTFFQKYDAIISLILGTILVIVIGVLTFSIISSAQKNTTQNADTESAIPLPTTYRVSEGETLWDISIKFYNSGYNWVTIAKANNLDNPDGLAIGQELLIPDATPIVVESGDILDGITTEVSKPLHTEITVIQGESLWIIATREYGSGYRWVDIAKSNVIITNPDLIYPNMVLRLP
ncbi:MAG: LysM peptidoglycan-binding domain-containing protein [Microgenomates group bacterium]